MPNGKTQGREEADYVRSKLAAAFASPAVRGWAERRRRVPMVTGKPEGNVRHKPALRLLRHQRGFRRTALPTLLLPSEQPNA